MCRIVLMFLWFALQVLLAEQLTTEENCGAVPMTVWADEVSHREDPLPRPIDLVIIQHTAGAECTTEDACEGILRGYRNYYISKLGWTDIAHSFYVGSTGKVYEGAGWSHVGAHTRGFNTRSIGVAFIGDFRDLLPTAAAQKAAQDLIKCGVDKEYLTKDYKLLGHSQLSATQSPGAAFYAAITHWPHWTNNTRDVYEGHKEMEYHDTIREDLANISSKTQVGWIAITCCFILFFY